MKIHNFMYFESILVKNVCVPTLSKIFRPVLETHLFLFFIWPNKCNANDLLAFITYELDKFHAQLSRA